MKTQKYLICSLFLLSIAINSIALPSRLHFFNQYTTAGYSIIRIPNTNKFALTGTLYKSPVVSPCGFDKDSTDIHFLVIDEEGNILTSQVYNSGANDYSYHITTFDAANGEFLLTTSTVAINYPCNGIFSQITYFVVNSAGTILQKHSFDCYSGNQPGIGLYCDQIGTRDIRPLRSIVDDKGITTVGVQKDYVSLTNTPLPYNQVIKSGFIKRLDMSFSPIWDKIYLNNSSSLPCYTSPTSPPGNDFDQLENIIEIPGKGYFVTGSTTIDKSGGASFDQGTVALLIDYNGTKIFDWSHYSTTQLNSNVNSADAFYSKIDDKIYMLENDEFNSTIRVVVLDPSTGSYSNIYTIKYDLINPDIKVMAYTIGENVNNPDELVITGLAEQYNLGPAYNYSWTPYIIVFDKSLTIGNTVYIQQAGAVNNSGYNLRGDNVQNIQGKIPTVFTPQMTASYDNLPNHDLMIAGYDYNATNTQYGLKMCIYGNITPYSSENNTCYGEMYDALIVDNSIIDINIDDFSVETFLTEVDYDQPVVEYQTSTCEEVYKSENNHSSDNVTQHDLDKISSLINSKSIDKSESIDESDIKEIAIFNLAGQQVLKSDNKYVLAEEIKANHLTSGIYILKFKLRDNKIRVKKIQLSGQ